MTYIEWISLLFGLLGAVLITFSMFFSNIRRKQSKEVPNLTSERDLPQTLESMDLVRNRNNSQESNTLSTIQNLINETTHNISTLKKGVQNKEDPYSFDEWKGIEAVQNDLFILNENIQQELNKTSNGTVIPDSNEDNSSLSRPADTVLNDIHSKNMQQSSITFFVGIGFFSITFSLLLLSIVLFTQNGDSNIITSIASAIGSIMSGGIGASLMKLFSKIKKETSDNAKLAAKQSKTILRVEAASKYISDKSKSDETIAMILLEDGNPVITKGTVE